MRLTILLVAALLPTALVGCGQGREAGPAVAADTETAAAIAFRDRVLAIVGEEFPDAGLETSVDPLLLRRGDAELHLGNLRAKCEAAGGIDSCRGVIREHFALILESLEAPDVVGGLDWETAKPRLRPQLTPVEVLEGLKIPHDPLGDGLMVAFVTDAPKNYRYVSDEDLARWGVSVEEVRRLAVANLEAATVDMPVAGVEGENQLLAVEIGDGYDATRLLLPGFRRFAISKLGEPFLAAVPNRDVLVMWSEKSSADFQASVRRSVQESFFSEAYPVSLRIFRVDTKGFQAVAQ